ncbi:MAG TPA: hypothetical protein VGE28_12260 [Pseudomonas sp.]
MSKQCVNCPGAVDHSTAECPVMTDATGPIDPIHSAMMLGMTPEPCEPVIEITRQAVTELLDVVEFGDQLERVEKERLVAFVKDILAQDQPELWATYSPGPGEVHPCMTKEHAEREAKATIDVCEKMRADQIARHGKADFWPTVVVDVIPSPFTPLEHFELLAEETIQHRDDLVEYVGELKNKLKDTPEPAWRPLIRLAMNLLNLRNHVPGSDVDLCVKALADLLEGKHSPAPESSEAWREVAELAQVATPAAVPPTPCTHEWIDDGQHLLVCTSCGAQEDHDPRWRDMATAPRDGTMVRLLVDFTEHATEDADQAPTIGANNFDNDGEDRWQFAGWCWSHDHFTQGQGEPIGWLPMLDEPRRIAGDQQEQQP